MGFWEELGKTACSAALAASYFTPIGPITGAITAGALVYGGTVEVIGHATGDKDVQKVGEVFRGIAVGAALDGISGGALEGIKMSKATAEAIKLGCEVTSKALEEKDKAESFATSDIKYLPSPDPHMTLFVAKNIKKIF